MSENTVDMKKLESEKGTKLLYKINSTFGTRKSDLKDVAAEQNLALIKYAALVVFLINAAWYIIDLISGGGYGLNTAMARAALILMGATSICMIVLSLARKKLHVRGFFVRASFVLYYLAIVAGIALLTITKNTAAVADGINPAEAAEYMGVTLASYLLLLLVFLPIPYSFDSAIVITGMIAGMIVPGLTEGHEVISWTHQIILRVCIVVSYSLYRLVNLHLAKKKVSEDTMNDKLTYVSYVDALTEVYNRRALNEYKDYLVANEDIRNIGVIIYDIDNFKKYNDYYTHAKGDEILVAISAAAKNTLSEDGEYLFRYGGEEFIAIIENATEEVLLRKAEEIHSAVINLNIPRNDDSGDTRVTVTLGCSVLPVDTKETDIITDADNQLYLGKGNGKNCVVFRDRFYGRDVMKEQAEMTAAGENTAGAAEARPVSGNRTKALIVDDIDMNREMLIDMLGDKFEILQAGDGAEAVEVMHNNIDSIAVILLDIVMPKMSGLEVLRFMREKGWIDMIPVLVISGERDPEIEHKCFEYGVSDFIQKPFNDVLVNMRVRNNIDRYQYREELEHTVREQLERLRIQNNKLVETNENVIELVADIVEARNLESGMHVRRVKGFTRIMAEQMMKDCPQYGLTQKAVDNIVSASAMHDVGKIMIEDAVLLKPGRLTPEEFERMKLHTVFGAEIIEKGKSVWDKDYYQYCYDISRYHHEKWDGRGYPDRLAGDEIPVWAQIVAVADCFDALTTDRVYKKAFSVDKAYEMITGGECGAFSPMLMDCFIKTRPQMEELVGKTRVTVTEEE